MLIAGRTADKIDKARDELAAKTGGEVHAVQADMTKEADIARMVETAKEKLGGVDILVNNAGTMYSGRFAVLDDNELKNQLETKLFGFMRAIRLVYPMMKAQKWGRIVNTIGGAGKEPDPYMFGSGMTNSALLNLTKSLSTEFGEDNVLVNAICPGWVDTNLWKRNAEGLKQELGVKSRGGGAQARGEEEFARPHGQAGGARQRHRVPVLGARELHHRRVAQPRRRAAEGAVVADAACRWHATARPAPRSVSAGSSVLHLSKAFGQRGWKRQPDGGLSTLGTSPCTMACGRCASTSGSATGIAASSASV